MDGDSGKDTLLAADAEFLASCAREMALLDLMEKTGYNMVQENGQRKYGGPPPGVCTDGENAARTSQTRSRAESHTVQFSLRPRILLVLNNWTVLNCSQQVQSQCKVIKYNA